MTEWLETAQLILLVCSELSPEEAIFLRST